MNTLVNHLGLDSVPPEGDILFTLRYKELRKRFIFKQFQCIIMSRTRITNVLSSQMIIYIDI